MGEQICIKISQNKDPSEEMISENLIMQSLKSWEGKITAYYGVLN